MTAQGAIQAVFGALGLPASAAVDMRVPKKLLVEQIAQTVADRKAIQEGIDELQWLATCRPSTVGIQAFANDVHEYLEIAVVACAFRPGAKSTRLIELIHRGIPYPVVLVTNDSSGAAVSVAHKRRALNEAGKVVVEHVVVTDGLDVTAPDWAVSAFLESILLAEQPKADLFSLYEGWLHRIEAVNAARLSGRFEVRADAESVGRRRDALEIHARLWREVVGLRARAAREKQLSRRVELNLEIQRLEAELASATANL